MNSGFTARSIIFGMGVGLILLLADCVTGPGGQDTSAKKLVEFGWDEPDTAFLRQHAAEMEQTPFDGCVFHLEARGPDGRAAGSFTWECWGTRAFRIEELRAALADLKAVRSRRFSQLFLRFNTTPGRLDWFDDHAAVLANAQLVARVAREGGCRGLLFDIEQYAGPLFNYRKQRDAAARPWPEYAAQVRLRGREVMQAFQRGYPGLTVFLTFGYSLPWTQCGGHLEKLPDASYGLLAPFLDGMLDAATGRTKLVDGHELSYGYKEPERFVAAYETMRRSLLTLVADPEKYRKHVSIGFGIWMDENWRRYGWDTNDFSNNYFTPATFEASVRKALEVSDEYVWIYTETPRWWSKEGGAVKLPEAYSAALRRAKRGL